MTIKTHTPGPWHVAPGMVYDVRRADGKPLAGTCDNPNGARRAADARLIAAAPDLLASLRNMVEEPSETVDWHAARAAIAKATDG